MSLAICLQTKGWFLCGWLRSWLRELHLGFIQFDKDRIGILDFFFFFFSRVLDLTFHLNLGEEVHPQDLSLSLGCQLGCVMGQDFSRESNNSVWIINLLKLTICLVELHWFPSIYRSTCKSWLQELHLQKLAPKAPPETYSFNYYSLFYFSCDWLFSQLQNAENNWM